MQLTNRNFCLGSSLKKIKKRSKNRCGVWRNHEKNVENELYRDATPQRFFAAVKFHE